jgi:hypothetical protein
MFSYQLVQELKKAKGLRTDLEASTLIAGLNSGNMSQIKSGKRHLTEEQALFIANECNLNPEWVLVHLAEEVSKYAEAKEVWSNLAKKIKKSVSAAILALIVVFGGLDANSEKDAVFV